MTKLVLASMFLLGGGIGVFAVEGTEGLPGWAQLILVLASFVGLVTKQIVPGWIYNDTRTECAGVKAENKAMVERMLDVLPKTNAALETGTVAVQEAMTEIRMMRRDRT